MSRLTFDIDIVERGKPNEKITSKISVDTTRTDKEALTKDEHIKFIINFPYQGIFDITFKDSVLEEK